jgi:hypothetical protein
MPQSAEKTLQDLFDLAGNRGLTVLLQHGAALIGARGWRGSSYFSSIANDANADLAFTIGGDAMRGAFRAAAGGDGEVLLYEAPDITGGTPAAVVCTNRQNAGISPITAVTAPTVNGVGTQLVRFLIPGGTGGNSPGDALDSLTDWLFAPATTYLLRVTNRSGQSKPVSIGFAAYTL